MRLFLHFTYILSEASDSALLRYPKFDAHLHSVLVHTYLALDVNL